MANIGDTKPDSRPRLHNSRSWMVRADTIKDEMFDVYAVFIFRWIAFSCLYESHSDAKHKNKISSFLDRVLKNDTDNIIGKAVKANTDLLTHFFRRTEHPKNLEKRTRNFQKQITNGNSKAVLTDIMTAMYILRNDIMHGTMAWNNADRKPALREAIKILDVFVPLFDKTMY